MVNYDEDSPTRNPRLGISVESSPEMKSTLTISNAGSSDAGNYTCKPSNALPASVQVFVSEGKTFSCKDRCSQPRWCDPFPIKVNVSYKNIWAFWNDQKIAKTITRKICQKGCVYKLVGHLNNAWYFKEGVRQSVSWNTCFTFLKHYFSALVKVLQKYEEDVLFISHYQA